MLNHQLLDAGWISAAEAAFSFDAEQGNVSRSCLDTFVCTSYSIAVQVTHKNGV